MYFLESWATLSFSIQLVIGGREKKRAWLHRYTESEQKQVPDILDPQDLCGLNGQDQPVGTLVGWWQPLCDLFWCRLDSVQQQLGCDLFVAFAFAMNVLVGSWQRLLSSGVELGLMERLLVTRAFIGSLCVATMHNNGGGSSPVTSSQPWSLGATLWDAI